MSKIKFVSTSHKRPHRNKSNDFDQMYEEPKHPISLFVIGKKMDSTNPDITQTAEMIRSSFELDTATAPTTEAELLVLLAERIEEMLEKQPDYLMSLLYRLDVLEEKIRPVMHPAAPDPAHIGLARLVLERQKLRVATKLAVKPEPLEGLDGWEWK